MIEQNRVDSQKVAVFLDVAYLKAACVDLGVSVEHVAQEIRIIASGFGTVCSAIAFIPNPETDFNLHLFGYELRVAPGSENPLLSYVAVVASLSKENLPGTFVIAAGYGHLAVLGQLLSDKVNLIVVASPQSMLGDLVEVAQSFVSLADIASAKVKVGVRAELHESRVGTRGGSEVRGRLRVFVCHASNDKNAVRQLCGRLSEDGFKPWLDEQQLLPGHDWEHEISTAVRNSDAIIVCLSQTSVTKEGFIQKEIQYALNLALEKPEGTIFIIPVKLEECSVPPRLSRWQWVNMFENEGYPSLVSALRLREQSAPKRA